MKRTVFAVILAAAFAVAAVPYAHSALASLHKSAASPLGRAGDGAQVKMTFSGTDRATSVQLQSGAAPAGEIRFAGNGSLGSFTYTELNSTTTAPSGSCGPSSQQFPIVAGAGIFRVQDGSLLYTRITQGSVCVDLSIPQGAVSATYQITGGTGRFRGASGALSLTAISFPLLFDSTTSEPVLFAVHDGVFTGTITTK